MIDLFDFLEASIGMFCQFFACDEDPRAILNTIQLFLHTACYINEYLSLFYIHCLFYFFKLFIIHSFFFGDLDIIHHDLMAHALGSEV